MDKLPKEHRDEMKLEDLFRLKRSESFPDQFWDEFDRKLHQGMLQARVIKEPWYVQVMHEFLSRVLLRNTAIAAAAAVVAAFICRAVIC